MVSGCGGGGGVALGTTSKKRGKKKKAFQGFLLPLPFGRITLLPEIFLHGGTKL